jgi:hypothetical protein
MEEDWGRNHYNARKAALQRLGVEVEEGGKAGPAKRTEPTPSDLLKVKDALVKVGRVEEVAKQAHEIDVVASLLGGRAVLTECLDALAKLGK